jgi:hypothetical protein
MDVMVFSISRSGNYQPQLDYAQVMFPDRECCAWLGYGLTILFPDQEIMMGLASKLTPIYTQRGAVPKIAPI